MTEPEAAGATTRARAEMHIAKGLPADPSPGSTGTKSGCNAHVAAALVQCVFRE
jgi:hypothetical protein